MNKKKLLLFITEDWYFWSHRLPIAEAAIDAGWEVVLVTRLSSLSEAIQSKGIKVRALSHFHRKSMSPLQELRSLLEIIHIYRQEAPLVSHHVALKPVIYGTVAAQFSRTRRIVNALAGMGFLFISTNRKISIMRDVLLVLFRLLFQSPRVRLIVQNPDDLEAMLSAKVIDKERIVMIRGSGVNVTHFTRTPTAENPAQPTIVLASRMLWDKGVGEFVEAARIVNRSHLRARFVLVGSPDPNNPASISSDTLDRWQHEGIVEWWGHSNDMVNTLTQASIVCLPSYREGLPKILLEGAAMGCPLIATDVPGCREVVIHGQNGLLVPPRDSERLAQSIEYLLRNPEICDDMGRRSRQIVMNQFADTRIAIETLTLYEDA